MSQAHVWMGRGGRVLGKGQRGIFQGVSEARKRMRGGKRLQEGRAMVGGGGFWGLVRDGKRERSVGGGGAGGAGDHAAGERGAF